MQLSLNQLSTHLKRPLLPVYLIYGEELLLRTEARDALRKAAYLSGYSQSQRFVVNANFDWQQISYECNNLSLFGEKTLIEISNDESKFDAAASKILSNYCQNPATDKLLLIVSDKLTPAQQKSAWIQAIKQYGVIIAIPTIRTYELPSWIRQRLQQAGLVADAAGIQLLAELTEGNLLACQQAIEKLRLLFPMALNTTTAMMPAEKNVMSNHPITLQQIAMVAGNQARFNIFTITDYMLKGDRQRVLFIMNNLQAEGTEPALLLWTLTKELGKLIDMLTRMAAGQSVERVIAKEWQQRQHFYKATLNRLPLATAKQLLQFAQKIDLMIKGFIPGLVWQQLLRLTLAIAGTDPLPKLSPDLWMNGVN